MTRRRVALENPQTKWWVFVVVFMIIFVSSCTLLFGVNSNPIFTQVPFFLRIGWFILFGGIYISTRRYNHLSDNVIFVMAAMATCVILSGVIHLNIRIGYFVRIILFSSGFLFAAVIPRKLFMEFFEKTVIFLAAYSLFFYVVMIVSPSIIETFPVILNTQGLPYYNMLFCAVFEGSERLFGPFSEPGNFQIFLNLALIFHIISGKRNFWVFAILISAIIATESTTGYFTLACILTAFAFEKSETKKQYRTQIFFVLLILGLIAYLVMNTNILSAEGNAFSKIGYGEESQSYLARTASVTANLHIWLEHPFLGAGITPIVELYDQFCLETYGVTHLGNQNTHLSQFSTLGGVYGLLYLIGFLKFFNRLSQSSLSRVFFMAAGFLMFSGNNFTENILIYIFVGYGYIKKEPITPVLYKGY